MAKVKIISSIKAVTPKPVQTQSENKEYPQISEEIMTAVKTAVRTELESKSFIYGADFPELLKNAGVENLRLYAKNVTQFTEQYLSDVAEMRKEVKIDGILKQSIIVPAGSAAELEFNTEKKYLPLPEEILTAVKMAVRTRLENKGFIYGADFPELLKNAGVENLQLYAQNTPQFIERYLSDVTEMRKKVKINGIPKKSIIVPAGSAAELDFSTEKKYLPLPEEILTAVKTAVRTELKNKGFIHGADFPELLKNAGVENLRLYAKNATRFIEQYLSDVAEMHKEIKIKEKKYFNIIMPIKFNIKPYQIKTIKEKVSAEGFAEVSFLVSLLKKYKIDIEKEESALPELIDSYFPDFCIKQRAYIGGKEYPAVLIRNKAEDICDYFCEDNRTVLDELFHAGDYIGFIRSPFYLKYHPNEIPLDILEKAMTCAKRILTGNDAAEIKFNYFQTQLITAHNGYEFIKNKHLGRYDDKMLAEWSVTSLPKHRKNRPTQALNDIFNHAKNTVNSEYSGLMKRAEACWNELYPLFTLIYIFYQPSKALYCINEMCKKLKKTAQLDCIPDAEGRWLYLPQIMQILHRFDILTSVPANTQTLIFGTFLELDALEAIEPISHFLSDKKISFVLNLLNNPDILTEDDYKNAFNNISKELFEKACSKLWAKSGYTEALSLDYLLLLAYVLKYGSNRIVDEIMRIPSKYGMVSITKLKKSYLLIDSLDLITQNFGSMPVLYRLGEYASDWINQMNASEITEEMLKKRQRWDDASEKFFKNTISGLIPVTDETAEQIAALFDFFTCNLEYETILQSAYADWYPTCRIFAEPDDEIKALMEKHAYLTVCRLAETLNLEQLTQESLINYVNALLFTHNYEQALAVTLERITDEKFLTDVIIAICFEYGISEQTREIFDSCFSVQKAINCLMLQQTGTRNDIAAALAILFALNFKPFRMYYIYNTFGDKAIKEYSRGMTQVFRWSKATYGGKLTCLYDKNVPTTKYTILEKAFYFLTPEKIVSLFCWCEKFKIPGIGTSQANMSSHAMASVFDKFFTIPDSISAWIMFYKHFVNLPDLNAWKLCVTLCIFEMWADEINNQDYILINFTKAEEYIILMLSSTPAKEFPVNFLLIFNLLFDRINNIKAFQMISDVLDNADVRERIFDEKINPETADVPSALIQKCLSRFLKTGEAVLLELAKKLDSNFSLIHLAELSEIIKFNNGKIFVLRELCAAFANGEKGENLRNLAASIFPQGMTYPAMKLLEAVRFIFSEPSEHDELIELIDSPELLDRVKKNAAEILSVYPKKKNLFLFDEDNFSAKLKQLVYTVVGGAVFDKDLFKQYYFDDYNKIKESDMLEVVEYFQYKLYFYQLYHNADATFLYLERRYLKALLSKLMLHLIHSGSNVPAKVEDAEILAAMTQFNHKDKCYSESYIPFKNELMKVIADNTISIEQKKHFVYILLKNDWNSFLEDILENGFTPSNPEAVRNTINIIAQRECSVCLYVYYLNNMDNDKGDRIVKASYFLSSAVHDALVFLKDNKDETLLSIMNSMLEAVEAKLRKDNFYSFGTYIKYLLDMDKTVFAKYKEFFIPFMVSVQFTVNLYDILYDYTISGKIGDDHLKILDYLADEHSEAAAVKHFLESTRAAMRGDKITAKIFFDRKRFTSLLPGTWNKLIDRLARYLEADDNKNFVPIRKEGDSSTRQDRSIQLSFITDYKTYFRINPDAKENADVENPKDMKRKFNALCENNNASEQDKINAGLIYLINLKKISELEDKKIAYQVAQQILSSVSVELTPAKRLNILCDAYRLADELDSNRFSVWSVEVLNTILNSGLPLENWCSHAVQILDIIKFDTNCDEETLSVLNKYLSRITVYLEPEYPLDRQLKKLNEIDAVSTIKTLYGGYLQTAINERIQMLNNKAQLEVKIVNVDFVSTDRMIYGMIKNQGRNTVIFGDGTNKTAHVSVCFNQSPNQKAIPIEYISTLPSQYMSGFAAPLPANYKDETIEVTISVRIEDELYSQCTETITIRENTETVTIAEREWYTVKEAVTDKDMLFGREDIKDNLRDFIKGRVTVIYGPSRIGKTSIMNWIKKDLRKETAAKSDKRIITISIAPEDMIDYDYNFHFAKNDTIPLDYSDNNAISEYLLVDSIKYGLELRSAVSGGNPPDSEFIENVQKILNQTDKQLNRRYELLGNYLTEQNTELWLLFDEFQQIVEKWKLKDRTSPFGLTINNMQKSISEINGIHIVFCGSDELLKHMQCLDVSVWRKIITTENQILVGSLPDKGFKEMIQNDKNFAKTGLFFSDEAVETLLHYTGGIALYGKQICNAILKSIASRHTLNRKYFLNRTVIYPYDISQATQVLLKRQDDEQKNNICKSDGVYYIYDAVCKNLDKNTDKLYLQYIAQWLFEHPDFNNFPKKCFYSRKLKNAYTNIEISLRVASRRNILKEIYENGITVGYKFTTLFYYYAFLGINKISCKKLESILFEPLSSEKNIDAKQKNSDKILTIAPQMMDDEEFNKIKLWSSDTQVRIVMSIISSLDLATVDRIKELIAKRYENIQNIEKVGNIGDNSRYTEGNDISLNIINSQITANITEAFNIFADMDFQLASKEKIMETFRKIPQFKDTVPQEIYKIQDKEKKLEQLAVYQEDYGASFEESILHSEKINLNAWIETEEAIEFFEENSIDPELLKELRKEHYSRLLVGFYLTCILKKIEEYTGDSGIDFTPASIMFCKTMECLLRENHLPLYKDDSIWIHKVKNNPKDNTKKEKDKTRRVTFPDKATIGVFTTAMATMFAIPDFDDQITEKEKNRDAFIEHTNASEENWTVYYTNLLAVQNVRNNSAHPEFVSARECEEVIDILFGKDLLNLTVSYIKKISDE